MSEIPVTDAHIHQALNALNRIEAEKQRNKKVSILQELKNNPIAQWLFYIDSPVNRHFGIKVNSEYSRIYSGTAKPDEMFARFEQIKQVIEKLLQLKITKNLAATQLEQLLAECSYTELFREGIWYTRLINHGLRLGLPTVAITECWPDLKITSTLPYARSILDAAGNVSEHKRKQIQYPCVAEPIVGGVLASIVIVNNDAYATAFGSRKIACLQPWADILASFLVDTPPLVINGEFITKQAYMGLSRTKQKERVINICKNSIFDTNTCTDQATDELIFVIYDIYTLASLRTGIFNLPYGHVQDTAFCRSTILSALSKKATNSGIAIKCINQIVCFNFDDIEEAHRFYLTQGFFGNIIKPCKAPLIFKPSNSLFKWKETKKQLGYILSVFHIKETIDIEVFVPETGITEHLHVPNKDIRDWFQEHKNSLNGYAVEFKETATEGTSKLCVLTKLLATKEPLSDIQIAALSERFGIILTETEQMSLKQFQSAASTLAKDDNV